MKGREISFCALAFLAGDFFGGWLTLPPLLFLLLAAISASGAAIFRRLMPVLLAFFLLGAASVQVGRMPPPKAPSALSLRCAGLKERVSEHLGTMVPDGDELAVLKALSVGDKGDISKELRADYRRSGAMHLLALSGLHVGIIYKILCGALFFLGHGIAMRRLRSAAVLAALWGFAFITGLSPSIARASLMITIYELSAVMRSGRDGVNALAAAALLICLADPEAPRGVGFQLSFCACLSLFTVFPFLRKLLNTKSILLRYVWDCLCVAISCQAATAPLSYLYFGTFPRYFLITNLFAVPVAAAVLYLLAASLIFAPLPVLSDLAVRMLAEALSFLNEIVKVVSDL